MQHSSQPRSCRKETVGVLIRAMQKASGGRNGPKKRNVLASKIRGIFSSACGSRKRAQQMCFYGGGEEKEWCTEGKERAISEGHGLALNETHPREQVHAMRRDEGSGRNCTKKYRRPRLASRLSAIFRESSSGFNLRRWKTHRSGYAHANCKKGLGLKLSCGRTMRSKVRMKRDDKRGVKKTWDDERAQAESEVELCKKRILMGGKCRPLNLSGALHYDKEGILLPEDVLPIE